MRHTGHAGEKKTHQAHPLANLRIFLCLALDPAIPRHCCTLPPSATSCPPACGRPQPVPSPLATDGNLPTNPAANAPGRGRNAKSDFGLTLPSTDDQNMMSHWKQCLFTTSGCTPSFCLASLWQRSCMIHCTIHGAYSPIWRVHNFNKKGIHF